MSRYFTSSLLFLCLLISDGKQSTLTLTGVGSGKAAAGGTTPKLKRVYANGAGMTSNSTDVGDAFKIYLDAAGPFAVASGDLVVVALKNHSTRTYTVTDDATSTWTVATNCTANSLKYSIVYASAAGPMTVVTLTAGANDSDISFSVYVFSGTATASITDGTDCKTGISGPTVSANAITTTVDNDIVLQEIFEQSFPAGSGSVNSGVTWGTSYTGLHDEVYFGAAGQFIVQSTHGSITASMTYSQAVSDTFASVTVAFKSGSGGTAPGTGIGILRYATVPINVNLSTTATAVTFPVANTGDAIFVFNEVLTGSSLTSVTDDASETFTAIACTGTCSANGSEPQGYLLCNATASNTRVITLHFASIAGNDLIGIYDIPGAAKTSGTACLDTAATAKNTSVLSATSSGATFNSGTESSTTISDAPSIGPSTSNGLIIGAGNIGNGPATKCAATCTFDYAGATWAAGSGDNSFMSNGDFMSHFYNSSTATANFQYTVVNNTSSWQAMMVALKAAP